MSLVHPIRSLRTFVGRLVVAGSYLAGHLARRDPRVWAFGNIRGYRDNPRYLAEHVARAYPGVLEAWWIARSDAEAERAREAGLNVAMRDGRGPAVQRRAGVAFLSNGFRDLQAAHLGGAFVVDLRHGQGTKRILLDSLDPSAADGWPRRSVRWVRRRYVRRRLAQIDMIVAPGEQEKRMYETAFGGAPERIRVLGSPRFDVILGGEADGRPAPSDIRARLGLADDDYAVLWLPTWREDGDADWLPPLDAATLDAASADTRIQLLVKLHPYSDKAVFAAKLPSHPRLRWITDDDEDVNSLLRIADLLVTDYSSAAFDFALLDRPIVFFAPDLDTYRARHGLLPNFESLVLEGHHATWESLLVALRELAAGTTDAGRDVAARIRAISRNMDEPGSCDRIVRAVADAVRVDVGVAA